jgi:hypothetical protein
VLAENGINFEYGYGSVRSPFQNCIFLAQLKITCFIGQDLNQVSKVQID